MAAIKPPALSPLPGDMGKGQTLNAAEMDSVQLPKYDTFPKCCAGGQLSSDVFESNTIKSTFERKCNPPPRDIAPRSRGISPLGGEAGAAVNPLSRKLDKVLNMRLDQDKVMHSG
jgi:hypothetical protein